MLIVLEGPDGAGKTTLAQAFMTLLSVKYPQHTVTLLHRGPPTQHPLNEYVKPLLNYRPGTDQHIICDRWHWGEVVYPRVLGRATKMDTSVFTYIEMFMQSRGAVTVLCNPDVYTLRARLLMRGDDFERIDVLDELCREYESVFSYSITGTRNVSSTPDSVSAYGHAQEMRAQRLNDFVTVIGHPTPKVLILGDVRTCSGLACTQVNAHASHGPAFMPYAATSGHYLLSSGIIDEHSPRVSLANACDMDDILRMYRTMDRPHVVALGANAHRRLHNDKIPHAVAPHPQYIRRFHHTAANDYRRLINELIGTERNELKWRPSSPETQDRKRITASFREF